MKLQKFVGAPMMVLGFGVAMLLASPVRAQQEIDPDTFDVIPGTPKTDAAQVPAAASTAIPETSVAQPAIVSAALFTPGGTPPMQVPARPSAVDLTMAAILMAGTGFVAFYVVVATRRRHGLQISLERNTYTSASGATTH
jgi:hypothetical protein